MENKQFKALIQLLEDPDFEVSSTVSKNLKDEGLGIIHDLEQAWETSMNKTIQERIENIIYEIQFDSTIQQLIDWKTSGADDLLEGAYLVARLQYPDLKFSKIADEIEKIRKDIWLEINNSLTALEKVKIINYILYDVYKYSSNTANFYSPQNSFINQVLESKKGNPISLAIVYSVIAARIGVPIFGVNLPKNFILAYMDELTFGTNFESILFYINANNYGAVLNRHEIELFLKQQQIELEPSYFIPCTNIVTIQRLLKNLIVSYENLGFTDKSDQFQKAFDCLNE
jgi:regulator of sirC expression with transglutaminase-like and TPR domain